MRLFLSALLVTAAAMPCAFAQDAPSPASFFQAGKTSTPTEIETARHEETGKTDHATQLNIQQKNNAEAAPAPITTPVPMSAAKIVETKQAEVPAPVGLQPTKLMDDAPAAAPTPTQKSLLEVLAESYGSSPTLQAEREKLRIQYEAVAQADALARPTLDAAGGIGYTHAEADPGSTDTFVSKDVSLQFVQPVWTGGHIRSYINQQLKLSDAQIASYEGVAQQVFLNVVTAAMDVERDRVIIDLNAKNRELIAGQLKAAENEFKVGSSTRTDVAQAKARLAEAESGVTSARAAYQSSLARFKQFAGMDASDTTFAKATENLPLPMDLMAAQSQGEQDNPDIVFARHVENAADDAVKVAEGDMSPDVGVVGTAERDWHTVQAIDDNQTATIALRATMNLYEGGATTSRIRQAKIARFEKADRVKEAQRSVDQQVATAWNNRQAALGNIEARKSQVDAATIAREGVYKEREVGTRTLLDTLDADRELLNAQVGLAQAEHDAVVADYALLASTGQLTPTRLGMLSQSAEHNVLEFSRGAFKGPDAQPRD